MDRPDYPQDEQPGTTNNVPALIHDYRAQREAWREQARNLARMREEVLAAADHEARGIVSAARADVRRILLKARRDLLVLAAQVRAAGRLGDSEDAADTITFLPTDDLGQVRETLTTARHDVRRVLDESRPELEGLAAEGEALRSALKQHRPIGPAPVEVRRHLSALPVLDAPDDRLSEATVDFEFTSIASDDEPDLTLRHERRPVQTLLAAAATIGALALMGTGWWLYRPSSAKSTAVESESAAATTSPASAGQRPGASAARTVGGNSTGDRRSPIPDSRSPLSLQLAVRRTSWMRVTADGRVTAERIFRAGETQSVRASKEVSVRTGDAGAVTVAVDGRQPVALGREGEVITRRFAVDAPRVQPPAPGSFRARNAEPGGWRRPISDATARDTGCVFVERRGVGRAAACDRAATGVFPAFSPAAPPAAATGPARSATVERPALSPTPAPSQVSPQDSLTNTASRWLDAYYRQDRATMAAISAQVNVSDDRGDKERLPRGLNGVRRSLEDVRFQDVGTEAMLTARMTERLENTMSGQMAVSYIHLQWTQRSGGWQLREVRIVSASTLSDAITR